MARAGGSGPPLRRGSGRGRPSPLERGGSYRLERRGGIGILVEEGLLAVTGVVHGFSTRLGPGPDGFDLGGHDAEGAEIASCRLSFARAAGLEVRVPAILHQVHGAGVRRSHEIAGAGTPPVGDAVIALRSDPPGPAPAVRWADCLPILLADSDGRALGAVHAGWRGTAAGVLSRAVEALQALGVEPTRLVVAFGPAIGACCYRVGPEVVEAVGRACDVAPERFTRRGPWGTSLCLRAANRIQLERLGVPPASIRVAPWCTRCRSDMFFSHRAAGGPTGRQMAVIGWAAG